MDEAPIETLIENNAGNPERSEDEDSLAEDLDKDVAYQSLSESDSDDEFKKITNFSSETAFDILYNQLSYTKIFLDYDLQKELALEIGVHVSTENPWKTIKKDLLEEYLTDSTVETENLRAKLSLFDDNDSVLLVGYHCPNEDNVEDGVFIVYDEIESILIATELIKKLEIWKRFKIKRALHKKPSRTVYPSRVDIKHQQRRPRISVEIQTSHTLVQRNTTFSFRTSSDCRDGYLELLPSKSENFQNVHRRRIAQGIQSAAQRVDCAQQTDPTFPTNAHTQYSYEILGEGKGTSEDTSVEDGKATEVVVVDPEETHPGTEGEKRDGAPSEDEEEEETLLSVNNTTVTQRPPIAVSKQIKELIRTLEFNQIDMYRIEYETIGRQEIPKFKIPYLEEIFCFAEIGKTANRHISCMEWHPRYSGLFIAAYTWDTLSTFIPSQNDTKVDAINKIILQPNYLFMWSFEDALNPVLSFETPREVATMSFHPLDPNCLVGGLVNGQVILWDLTDLVENAHSDIVTSDQCPYREDMRKFLNWTKHSFSNDVVKRSAISCLEFSHTERVTDIKWLNTNIYLSSAGEIKESAVDSKQEYRYFVTSSLDGTVAFWNLADGSIPEEKVVIVEEKKKGGKPVKKKTPVPEVQVKKSRFAHFDRKFRPQFVVVLQEPISSFVMNSARFLFEPIVGQRRFKSADLAKRTEFKATEIPYSLDKELTLEDEEEGAFNNHMIVTTLSGDVMIVKWKGMESDPAAGNNRQDKLILKPFPSLHDGPIVAMHKNPLMPLLILTIGQTTVSIWRSDFIHGAIYWQQRTVELTDCKWSALRPSVFFLTRVDGVIEIWDLISSTHDPCLVETISGGVLTAVSQHRLPFINVDVLAIGDYNSNARIFKLPKTFATFTEEERKRFVEQIDKEVERKEKLRLWQEQWKVENQEILTAKKKLMDIKRVPSTVKQLMQAEDQFRKKTGKKDDPKKNKKSLIERSELKLEQTNMKRLMQIMMTIKDIDPKECNQKTLPIREQRAYSDLKRTAIKREFSKIGSDLAKMRSRILPIKEDIKDRKEIVKSLVRETILTDEFDQEEFDKNAEKKLQSLDKDRPKLSLTEIKQRGRHTREILNKSSIGIGTMHKESRDLNKKERMSTSMSHLKSLSNSPDKL